MHYDEAAPEGVITTVAGKKFLLPSQDFLPPRSSMPLTPFKNAPTLWFPRKRETRRPCGGWIPTHVGMITQRICGAEKCDVLQRLGGMMLAVI